MREIRPSSLEGGVRLIPHPYPYRENVRYARNGQADYLSAFPSHYCRGATASGW